MRELADKVFIVCPTIRPGLYEDVKNSVKPFEVSYFDGEGVSSFSFLVNKLVVETYNQNKEILIFIGDRMRPKSHDIEKLIRLIDEGYAWVGMYCFGFWGCKLDLFRTIGWFDQRYQGGGLEDSDWMIRCAEANLAIYESKEISCLNFNTSWKKNETPRKHFENKWLKKDNNYVRLLKEEKYNYRIGRYRGNEFKSWTESITIFSDWKTLNFSRPLFKNRTKPNFGYKKLFSDFFYLTWWKVKRHYNKFLRWYYA